MGDANVSKCEKNKFMKSMQIIVCRAAQSNQQPSDYRIFNSSWM